MNYNIIGREKEISELQYLLGTDKSEFLAVYGRRRVGKSFLVDEVYKSAIAFRTVGVFIKSEELTEESYRQKQLKHFLTSSMRHPNQDLSLDRSKSGLLRGASPSRRVSW